MKRTEKEKLTVHKNNYKLFLCSTIFLVNS